MGTFVKTPAHAMVEVLGKTTIDFVVLDAEHAPFDRHQIDICVMAGRASGVDVLVRIPDGAPSAIQNVLDVGASGVILPRVSDPATASAARRSSSYSARGRGYSNSPRAGGYGTVDMGPMLEIEDRRATVICQIEDTAGVDNIEALVALDDIDGFLLGRADLSVAYGCTSITAPRVNEAVYRVAAVCRSSGKALGIFVSGADEVAAFIDEGMTFFVLGSDQSAVLRYFRDAMKVIRKDNSS